MSGLFVNVTVFYCSLHGDRKNQFSQFSTFEAQLFSIRGPFSFLLIFYEHLFIIFQS